MVIKKFVFFFISLVFFTSISQAGSVGDSPFIHSFYFGGAAGYGSTTWNGLVPTKNKQNSALNMSTPIEVKEGGTVWNAFVGYEFIPSFAIEVNYMNYPKAKVIFDPDSLFSFDNDGLTKFYTRTETIGLMGKIMLIVPHTSLRVYSSIGAASVHRTDMLLDKWRASPSFGAGLNYHLTQHLMIELAGNYIAGYGESRLNPTEVYFPFLYSVALRLALCF